ncbi:MAG: glyceraldehyde-3-phosphate dehydrogenase/erythrose-4-phosphate dehydrogenase [Paraglaciecola sp.]|jgi:glyceraldehyde-3-phosphate dehydrogenase/erythrose-4-phosphate dehydrogenase
MAHLIESTGIFTKQKDAEKYIKVGAKTVVLSVPSKSPDVPSFPITEIIPFNLKSKS